MAKQRLYTSIKMKDDSIVFVRLPKAFNTSSVKYFEYAWPNTMQIKAVTLGGTVLVFDVHAKIHGGKSCVAA